MGYSLASCDKGAFYTNVVSGRLGFEVWMHASSFDNRSAAQLSTLATEQQPTTTAYIDAGPAFINALNLTVKIVFEAPCQGFLCENTSSCDLIVMGDGVVLPSTLKRAQGGLSFSLTVALQTQNSTGKVMLGLAKGLCTNLSEDSSSSPVITIRFDRRPVTVNLWTAIPDVLVQINNVSRTIQATNKITDLIFYLDFSHPVRNSSQELSRVLTPNYGVLKVLRRKSHGNRRFGFKLASVPSPAVVTVSLDTSHVFSRAGTIVRRPIPAAFLYDMVRPQVRVFPGSSIKTPDRNVPVLIEFTKPVFNFDSQSISVLNGRITSFNEISKSVYALNVLANEGTVIAVSVKANSASDITGNLNAHSNVVRVRHYVIPAVSIGVYTFTTASVLATSFTAAILAISSASLAAAGALTTTAMKSVISDPSRNLLGLAGHLQVFVLSHQMAVSLPIVYLETTRGLQWLIPRAQLPWERQGSSAHSESLVAHTKHTMPDKNLDTHKVIPAGLPFSSTGRGRRLGANASVYGPALTVNEYDSFFQIQTLDSLSSHASSRLTAYRGWHDFASNTFWLGALGGALILSHFFVLGILRWRCRTTFMGALLPPRFELFLLIYGLPGFCQALAFIIRGGTTVGIIVGIILLAVPAGLLLSVILFLSVAIFGGRFVQYNEVRWQANKDACVFGDQSIGSWTCKDRLPSTFLSRFGLLFEDRKGPLDLVCMMEEENLKSLPPRWVDSGSSGIGSLRAVNHNDERHDKEGRLYGAGQASYVVLDLARRTLLGITFGAYNPAEFSWSQVSIVLGATLVQLSYLLAFRPYIRRGVQAAETVSVLCEAVLFGLGLVLLATASTVEDEEMMGVAMLALLMLSLVVQLANEWYALMNQVLRIAPSQDPSLRLGLKMLFWGLLLPLFPKGRSSRFMSSVPVQLKSAGLVTVVPVSPEVEVKAGLISQNNHHVPSIAESVALPYGTGSSSFIDSRMAVVGTQSPEITTESIEGQELRWNQGEDNQAMLGRGSIGATATSNELKALRDLAKASFPCGIKDETMTLSGAVSKGLFERTPLRARLPLAAHSNSEDDSLSDFQNAGET